MVTLPIAEVQRGAGEVDLPPASRDICVAPKGVSIDRGRMARLRVVFDLDDTLYPERMFAISGFRACERWADEQFGVAGLVEPMTSLLDDGHMRPLFEIVLAERVGAHAAHLIEDFIGIYRDHEPRSRCTTTRMPRCASGSQGPLGLITDGSHQVQSAKVRASGSSRTSLHIIYTSALGGRGFSKPNPLSYELMEATIGVPGDRFVYIGDNPAKDFVTPNARGWTSVQIVRPQRIHCARRGRSGGAPHHTITSLPSCRIAGMLRKFDR